ncbi:MAG: energy transducer TonB [Thermodesulfobacteriota bacterium]|nr:energy transducer TonB [Thermodesulfobacteriota bacterium]
MTFLSEALERNHGDTMSLNNMVVLSFLLHALILSIIFFSPSLPSPKWTFGPSYTVDLVSLPSSSVEVRSSEAIPREVVGLNRKNRSIIIKKDVAKSLYTPVRKTKIHRKSTSGNADTAIDGIKKKVASTAKAYHPATSRGHSEMNLKMKVYYSVVWSMIKEKWALPEGILPDDNLEAIIEATILKNGSVSNLSFEKNSGNRYFDESTIKAIKKAEPFPPLPEWLDERYIDLGIRFHSSEL